MKLKKIRKIRDFGVFRNFIWKTDVPAFSNFNIFYGWNYSGKTTLSRILRCFELRTSHPDYETSKFEIEDDSDGIHNESLLSDTLSVRVFNSDYIVDNLKWHSQEEAIQPILLLGQESIELTLELENEKDGLRTDRQSIEAKRDEKTTKIDLMNHSLTDKAREIKEFLGLPNFTKAHLEPKVIEIAEQPATLKLTEEEYSTYSEIYLSTEKRDSLPTVSFPALKIAQLNEQIAKLLRTTVKSKVIEKLRKNRLLNDWVKTGKSLHEKKKVCEFCGSKLPSGLLQQLSEHFSAEYEKLMQSLESQIRKVTDSELQVTLPNPASLYPHLREPFTEELNQFDAMKEELNNYLANLATLLQDKRQKPFDEVEIRNRKDDFGDLDQAKNGMNEILKEHNQKTRRFENERNTARDALTNHYVAEFAETNKFLEHTNELLELDQEIDELGADIQDGETKILALEKKLSETVKGAEKINDYLFQYFGKNDIKVIVNEDEKFQLTREGVVARNLSEGEKTAIAFAYFAASLENKDTNLAETVVFIDDPISSLDSNHLFNTYSLVRNIFYEYERDPNTNERLHKCKAAQLFVSTHNFEFFNLIKDWLRKVKGADKSFYLIEKIRTDGEKEAVIKELPKELLKFKSEYVYLFSIIYEFFNNSSTDFRFLYNLPNIVRRFIESFCAFKYLSTLNIDENLDLLIKDSVKRERVRKFAHYYSHSLSAKSVMEFSDPTESHEVIEIVLEALKTSDIEHYDSLIQQVTQ